MTALAKTIALRSLVAAWFDNVFSTGRKGLKTIDQNRKQPPDDPWKFWEEATAEEKRLEDAELAARDAFHPVEFVPFRMMAAGPRSQLRAGSWMISTCAQNNGTTIEVKYDPVLKILGDHSRLANDAKRLGMRYTHSSRQHYISEQAKHMAVSSLLAPLCFSSSMIFECHEVE